MMLWIAGAALAVMTIAFVVAPLVRRSDEAHVDHAEGALAIFADQIAEVEREADQGLISGAEAEAAKVEIKRRMLAVAKTRGSSVSERSGRGLIVVLALIVPVIGGGLYWQLGSPDVPSQPYASRADERANSNEVAQLASRLRTRLLEDESGGPTDGWVLLGQTYFRMGRYGDAALAFARVIDRPEATAGMLTQYAEALIASEDGLVTNRAAVILERAMAMEPRNPAATYYQAQWLDQEGRAEEAQALLADRLGLETSYQPWMDIFVEQINRIAAQSGGAPVSVEDFVEQPRGPSQEDMNAAAEMSAEDRSAMIQSMVEGLAARLEDEPDDLDGWLQLGRAYLVLQQPQQARAAYEAAEGLLQALPVDDPRRAVVAQGLEAAGG
ncbi:c-type cytochrome biogenesis protein CcmI [Primorskyibacter sp. S187A]|uniref:c-type cytochrome biogenesis protein CcmI n=1 Tax=Primorskyibacter sp. S187A TaxID=3415130 RepID=UPI003C7DAA24